MSRKTKASTDAARRAPALGERVALIGYYAQNRGAAALVLSELFSGRLEWVRFGDITAGRVDDLQIATPGRLDAYQFKWGEYARGITLRSLLNGRTGEPAILRALADGWRERSDRFASRKVVVHLVTNHYPSTSDTVTEVGGITGQSHFAAFLRDAWEPVELGELEVSTENGWIDTWREITTATGFEEAELTSFVRHCRLDLHAHFNPPEGASLRERDEWEITMRQFIERLFALPSQRQKAIQLDRVEILSMLGLSDEAFPRQQRDFRLSDHIHEPLEQTAAKVNAAIDQFAGGYVCLLGTPGSGKSSLLTQVLRARPERTIRYYAYTPDGPNTHRGEAVVFLTEMVEELERLGVPSGAAGPHRSDRLLLQERFQRQLKNLAQQWHARREKTILLVDGLDHIEREQNPLRSLLDELPAASAVPDGVLILLGSQSDRFLQTSIRLALEKEGRRIVTEPLSAGAVRRTLRGCGLAERLDDAQRDQVIALTDGHPLALAYLIQRLLSCSDSTQITEALTDTKPYGADVNGAYRAHWEAVGKADFSVRHLLGLLARLRRPADAAWIHEWANTESLDVLERRFSHFFRRVGNAWEFFHNSFRLFVLEETAVGFGGEQQQSLEARFHRELAAHCASAPSGSHWRWEELYHRREAGEYETVLQLATVEWFRAQFFAWRSRRAVSADLWLANSALAQRRDGLSAIRIALARHEMESRFEALQIEETRLLELLLRTGRRTEALARIREGSKLLVGEEAALEICETLYELGDREEAARLLDLVDPHAVHPRGISLNETADQRRFLVNWSLTALLFLSPEDVLRVVETFVFANRDRAPRSGRPAESQPDSVVERHRTLALLSAELLSRDEIEVCEVIQSHVDWQKVPAGDRLEFMLSRVELDIRRGELDQAKVNLQDLVRAFPKARTQAARLRIAEALARAGSTEEARVWFRESDAPTVDALGECNLWAEARTPDPVRWLRMYFYLGATAPLPAFTASSSENEGMRLLARGRVAAAQLWAEAWSGTIWLAADLERRLDGILRPLLQNYQGMIHWRGVHDLHRLRYGICRELIWACAASRLDSLRILAEYLKRSWNSASTSRFWLPNLQRLLITELLNAGMDRSWAVPCLEQTESEIEIADNAGGRVSQCVDQAEAWLLASQRDRALAQAERAQQLALGMGYNKDYQLSMWLRLLRESWNRNPFAARDSVALVARSIVALRHEVSEVVLADAAITLLEQVFPTDPAFGLRVWEYFHRHGSFRFDEAVDALLRGTLRFDQNAISIVLHVLAEVLVSVAQSTPDRLLVNVFSCLVRCSGSTAAQDYAELVASRIETFGRPGLRGGWWRALSLAARDNGFRAPTPRLPIPHERDPYHEAETGDLLLQILNASDPIAEVCRMLREERNARDEQSLTSRINWLEIARGLVPRMPVSQILALVELLSPKYPTQIASLVAPYLVHLNAGSEAWRLGERALAHLEGPERPSYVGPHEWLNAVLPLLQSRPDAGREQLFNTLAAEAWLRPEQFHEVLPWLLLDEAQRSSFFGEINRHVAALLAGCDASAPPLTFDSESTSPLSAAGALCELVVAWLDHPSGIVRHAASRTAYSLTRDRNEIWMAGMNAHLRNCSVATPALLGILDSFAHEEPACLDGLQAVVKPLTEVPDLDLLWRAVRITSLCQWPVSLPTVSDAASDPVFRLHLPELKIDNQSPTLLKLLGLQLSAIARPTGIPLANLWRRCEILADELCRKRPELARNRSDLNEQLDDLGLHHAFRAAEQPLAERVGFRLLAELRAMKRLPEESIPFVWRLFSQRDSAFAGLTPGRRPTIFATPAAAWENKPWSEEWLGQEVASPICGPQVEDGWLVLAYQHAFRVHTDYLPEERHVGTYLAQQWPQPHRLTCDDPPFESVRVLAVEEYPDWPLLPRIAAVAIQPDLPLDWPGPRWLALHPAIARDLGWRPANGGMFSWENERGERMAESRWWTEGPPASFDTHERDVTANGWFVAVAPGAMRALQGLLGPLKFHAHGERIHAR